MRVAFQGEPGSFSESAARLLVPSAEPRGLPSFRRAVEAVASGEVARAVVPVENSVAGSVPEVVDLLLQHAGERGLAVVAETWVRAELALLALPKTSIAELTEVRSHPHALRQAAAFLEERAPSATLVAASDTAGAARVIAQEKLAGVAAIASRRAAELYGLEVLAEHVEAERRNQTRFFLLAPAETPVEGADKTTLVLTPSLQAPNALFRALTTFVGRRLAVLRIEPRPRLGRPGEYHYVVDVEGAAGQDPLKAAIADAGAFCDQHAVIGSYRAAEPE